MLLGALHSMFPCLQLFSIPYRASPVCTSSYIAASTFYPCLYPLPFTLYPLPFTLYTNSIILHERVNRNTTKLFQTNTYPTNSLMALALFTTVVFVWIPYALKGCKNVEHRCGNPDCKALLATFHRTFSPGDIEVHKFN